MKKTTKELEEVDLKKERKLRKQRKEKLEVELYRLKHYICSCPWEVHQAFYSGSGEKGRQEMKPEKTYTKKQLDRAVKTAVKSERDAIVKMVCSITDGSPQPIRIGRGACLETIVSRIAWCIKDRGKE
jgi:hypothetical protein